MSYKLIGNKRYKVSTAGQVWSLYHGGRRKVAKLLRPVPTSNGYLRVSIGGRCQMLSRVVLEAFRGPAPSPTHQAAHLNGVYTDNRLSNLAWKTPSENAADKFRHGTGNSPRGSYESVQKLDPGQVHEIRRRLAGGEGVVALARDFGVAHSTIQKVRDQPRWYESRR